MKDYLCFGRYKKGYYFVLVCLLFLLVSNSFPSACAMVYASNIKEDHMIGYAGQVTGRVNVRVDAGTNYQRVEHNGEAVQLQVGEEVIILSEKNVGTKPWYQVRFTRDAVEITGYATSTYITKSDVVITPIPEPTPSNTPTPTIAPTKAVEQPVVNVAVKEETSNDQKASGVPAALWYVVMFAAVVIIGVVCYIVLKKRSNHVDQTSLQATKAVEQLQKIQIKDSQKQNNPIPALKRRPEVKESKVTQETYQEVLSPDVYLKNNRKSDEEFASALEPKISIQTGRVMDGESSTLTARKEKETHENTDGEWLKRSQMDLLKEHDFVQHKYFGAGEIFDNTDVRLIEVRFGSDVRFLNKDNLAIKKLLFLRNEKEI